VRFEDNKEKEAPTTIVMSSVFMCEGEDGKGHSLEAISDSGTNINVMSRQAAEKLQNRTNVEKEERGGSQYIRFGKEGAKERILYHTAERHARRGSSSGKRGGDTPTQ
jgi:hypothetical protein